MSVSADMILQVHLGTLANLFIHFIISVTYYNIKLPNVRKKQADGMKLQVHLRVPVNLFFLFIFPFQLQLHMSTKGTFVS